MNIEPADFSHSSKRVLWHMLKALNVKSKEEVLSQELSMQLAKLEASYNSLFESGTYSKHSLKKLRERIKGLREKIDEL